MLSSSSSPASADAAGGGAGSGANDPSSTAALYEQLEKRIKALETEIPFYSSKAAELMVQRTDDNTYKIETERRLEELAMLREQIKRIPNVRHSPQTPAGTLPPPLSTASSAASVLAPVAPPVAAVGPLPPVLLHSQQVHLPPTPQQITMPSPLLPVASLAAVAPVVASMPVAAAAPPPPPALTASAIPAFISTPIMPPARQMAPPASSADVTAAAAAMGGGAAMMRQPSQQQQQQQQVSRRELAIAHAKKRASNYSSPIEAIFLCSLHLEYNDLITLCLVSKMFKSKIKRSAGWRRIVIGLEATLRGHIGKITALTWFDTAIVTGGADGKIKFWDKNYNCFKTNNITPTPAHKFIHPKLKELQQRGSSSTSSSSGGGGHHHHHHHHHSGSGLGAATGAGGGQEDEYPEFALAVTSLLTLDQKTILIGSEDGRLIVWITTEKRDFDCYVFNSSLTCMTLNHDLVFLGSAEGRVAVMSRRINLSAPYAQLTPQHFFQGNKQHNSAVTALAFAGSYMFSGAANGNIYVWRVGNTSDRALEFKGKLTGEAPREEGGGDGVGAAAPVSVEHTERITALAGSSERLFSASWDCTIKQWNPLTLELLRNINVLPIGICWSLVIRRDQKPYSLVAGVRDNDLCVMDFETLEVLSSCNAYHWTNKLNRHTSRVRTLFAHPDGRIISGGSDDWTVKVWSARGRCIQTPQPFIFFGLPKGPICKEDLEILLSKSGSKYTPQHLQDSKHEFDRACYATENLSAEQKAEYQFQAIKQQEAWEKYRSEKRKKDELAAGMAMANTVAAVMAVPPPTAAMEVPNPKALLSPPTQEQQQMPMSAETKAQEVIAESAPPPPVQQQEEEEESDLLRQASILSQQNAGSEKTGGDSPALASATPSPHVPASSAAPTTSGEEESKASGGEEGNGGKSNEDGEDDEEEEEEDDEDGEPEAKRLRQDAGSSSNPEQGEAE